MEFWSKHPDAEPSLRGIGSEYTQILINGRRVTGGTNDNTVVVDRIPAELVDRVEIIRSPSSDIDSQGVGGTLNIILKEGAELTGGIYFGHKSRQADFASDVCTYTAEEIARVTRVAATLARQRRGKLTSIDKANVLATSRLWRKVVDEERRRFPGATGELVLVSRPDLTARYPLVITSAKVVQFCHSQHRSLPRLRRHSRDPQVELHPSTAEARGIAAGDWVVIETPRATMRARARLDRGLAPGVVCAQFGWWQACEPLGLGGYPAEGPAAANYNALIDTAFTDPLSGTVPLRSALCEIRRAE